MITSNRISTGEIIGISIGALIVISLVLLVIIKRVKRKGEEEKEQSHKQVNVKSEATVMSYESTRRENEFFMSKLTSKESEVKSKGKFS